MEDDGDSDIYSGLGEYCSESTSDATDSHLASAAELDLLDSSVLPKQPSPVKSERRSQGSARSAVERDSTIGTYFDLARSSSVSDDSKDTRSAVPAKSESSDISVPPGQPEPSQKEHLTKTVARPRPATSLVAHDVKANASAASAGALKTMAALKRENEMLRHNISILFKTAKHLMDSKDKEIAYLKRRLDNLVFKRNQRPQNSPHATVNEGSRQQHNSFATTNARSTHDYPPQHSCGQNQPLRNSPLDTTTMRDAHHQYQAQGEPSRDLPRISTTQTSRNSPLQERSRHLQPIMPTKANADMSEDLQRLYQYNSVRPENRTDFSRVPALAVTPNKKESVSRGGVVTPTKSAAQRNARRLVKNSIKNVIGSPSKKPRRLEAYNKIGSSPLKKKRPSKRTAFAEKLDRAAQHNERRGAFRLEMPLEHWEWEPRVKEPRTPPYAGSRVFERPCSPRQGWPEESVNNYRDSPQLREKNIHKGPRTPPQDQTKTWDVEIPRTPPRARKVVKGPHTPPEEYPVEWTVERSETPPLEGEVVTEGRPTKAENQLTAMKSDVSEICGLSKNVAPVGFPGSRSPSPFKEMTALSGKRSEEVQHREHLGIKHRRSPCEPSRNRRVPQSSTTVDKPLGHNSPGCGSAVESRRYYSPREFGSLPTKRRRSRSRSPSPPPRSHSPRQHSQAHRTPVHDRLGYHFERHRIVSHRHHSPEDRNLHRRLRERYSPVPRRHHRTDRRSPSPPRSGRTSRRQPSPGRRPKSPLVRDKAAKESPLHKQPAKRPLKRISTAPGSDAVVQVNENAGGACQEPEVSRLLDENTFSCPQESETSRTASVVDVNKETKEAAEVTALCDSGDG